MISKEKYSLTRDEFRELFIEPLEEEFGYKTYWNTSNLKRGDIQPIKDSKLMGMCYTGLPDRPIVLKYRINKISQMLSTLIHEYTHAELHVYESKDKELCYALEEFECESVAFKVLSHFGIKTNSGRDAEHYYNRCDKYTLDKYHMLERGPKLEEMVDRVIDALCINTYYLEKLSYLSKNPELLNKYKVVCPYCDRTWYFNKMVNIIKNNGEGYSCGSCGDKTLNSLVIYEL